MDTERQISPRRAVAILSRGDAVARRDATSRNGRFVDVFEALAAVGVWELMEEVGHCSTAA